MKKNYFLVSESPCSSPVLENKRNRSAVRTNAGLPLISFILRVVTINIVSEMLPFR